MNQRPFISSNLNIYDETRCIFSSSFIGGQPVVISQEQNRKVYDTLMTSITSNQQRIGNCCYPSQQPAQPNQSWPCTLQAQKQGVPEGVLFNFPQANYSVPLSCVPTAYTPPPPPAPQIVECPYKTPQSVCVDFRKYGLEAMMFQEKLRNQYCSFSYDKKVGTSDQYLYPNSNLCCCGTQSTTLTAEQKQENYHRVDDTDHKNNLNLSPCEERPKNRKECVCFSESDSDESGYARTKIKGREDTHRHYVSSDHYNKKSNSETNIGYDFRDKLTSRTDIPKSSCLKNPDGCTKENANPKKCVSFTFCGKTLIMSENKENQKSNNDTIKTNILFNEEKFGSQMNPKKTLLYRDVCTPKIATELDLSKEKYQCDIIRQITHLKRKRKGLIRMYSFFNDNLLDSLRKIDKEIDDLRRLCHENNLKKINTTIQKCGGNFKQEDDWEELVRKSFRNQIPVQTDNLLYPSPSQNSLQKLNDQSEGGRDKLSSKGPKIDGDEKKQFPKYLAEKNISAIKNLEETTKDEMNHLETIKTGIPVDDKYTVINTVDTNEIVMMGKEENNNDMMNKENLQKTPMSDRYMRKYVDLGQHTDGHNSETRTEAQNRQITNDIKLFLKEIENAAFTSVEGISNPPSSSCKYDACAIICTEETFDLGKSKTGISMETNTVDLKLVGTESGTTEVIGLERNVIEKQNLEKVSNTHLNLTREDSKLTSYDEESYPGQPERNTDNSEAKNISGQRSDFNATNSDEKDFNGENNEMRTISGRSHLNGPQFVEVESDKINIIEPGDNFTEDQNFGQNTAPSASSCDPTCHNERPSLKKPEIEKVEVHPIFLPCTCGRNLLSKCGNALYTLFTESIEKMRTIWRPSQPCVPIRTNNSCYCYRDGPDKYKRTLNRSTKICHERLGTNKFCGKTSYDVERNCWYSCCSQGDEHVVQITFRETAERRFVLLKNGCRNTRFHVVYE